MLDPRLYRAAFVLVLFALILAAFSLQDRPNARSTRLPPDAFDGLRAIRDLRDLDRPESNFRNRRPGSVADDALARRVASRMRANDFRVRTVSARGETIDGEQNLQTVIGERTGTADGRIVVVAHRDSASEGAIAELSGTAALLELARLFGAPRQTRRTLVLVSTSGGSGGGAGAAELARQLEGRPVEAVLVLGDMASVRLRPPFVVSWSNGLGATVPRLQRTLEEAVKTETGTGAGLPRAVSQMARFALPATYGEQGVLLDKGLPAVLLSASGERAPPADAEVSRARLQAFGRAALRTITALDTGTPIAPEATSADVLTERKVLPGWAVRLLVGMLLLPPLIAAVDALARVSRRGEHVMRWLRWSLVSALPFALVVLVVKLMDLTGLLKVVPAAPTPPDALPVEPAALIALLLVFALGWFARPAVLRAVDADGDAAAPGAAVWTVLLATIAVAVMWARNPYTALLLVLALHVWLFALAPEFRRRAPAGLAIVALSLVPFLLVAAGQARALDLGPLDAVWVLLLAIAGGHVSLPGAALWCLLSGCAASASIIAVRGSLHAGDESTPITMRGPRSYAGPGSLGGTESGMRRR